MKLANFFSDRTTFESADSIRQFIVKSKNYGKDESSKRTNILLIFNTSSQHTWLVASEKHLYCILDDIGKPAPHINWSIKKDNLVENNKIKIKIVVRDKNKNTGLIDFGESYKGWLFSKKCFVTQPIETMFKKIIQRSMILNEFK